MDVICCSGGGGEGEGADEVAGGGKVAGARFEGFEECWRILGEGFC